MHMLRNAVSHGLESEAERKSRGKHPEGRIDLAIEVRGNRLNIAVEDDGRGIDLAKVSEIAIRKGLIGESEVAAAPPAELMRLILLPGFSTSRSVTELSGRGMGLSVVAQAVARLQGTVDIGPGTHGGTRVAISAPLSVSSHRLLLVTCQSRTFAIPLHGIERLHRVKLTDVHTVESKSVITVDGQPVSVVSLAHLLNTAEPRVSVNQNTLCVMIMRTGIQRLAVAVDAFLSERDAIIKDLPAPADGNAQIAGGILLEDGSVCLVLNPAEIVEGFQQSSNALVLATPCRDAGGRSKSSFEILVVDDSLTTRTLEKSVLEAHGYQVAIAVDGVDALNYLRAGPVGLVISDLQMPRLDGFGLLEEMKRRSAPGEDSGDHRLVSRKPRRPGPRHDARRRRVHRQAEVRTAGAARNHPADSMKKIGVLIVEDSEVVQQLLRAHHRRRPASRDPGRRLERGGSARDPPARLARRHLARHPASGDERVRGHTPDHAGQADADRRLLGQRGIRRPENHDERVARRRAGGRGKAGRHHARRLRAPGPDALHAAGDHERSQGRASAGVH